MNDERKDIENPWNELKPSEVGGPKHGDASAARKPAESLPPGSYGELNYKDEDSPESDKSEGGPRR